MAEPERSPVPAPVRGRLVEAFSSLQGEGRRMGERQIFLRFAGCDRRCAYCDTPGSLGPVPGHARLELRPGSGVFEARENPLGDADLSAALARLAEEAGPRPVVSLTGGEPLLQAAFLECWLPTLGERYEVVLETHGLRPAELARVVEWVDEVVMDVKVPSATGEPTAWELHRSFVVAARRAARPPCLKAVVARGTTDEELEAVLDVFALAGEGAACYLQPVTPLEGGPAAPRLEELLGWQGRARARGLAVRVTPQIHRVLGIR